MRSGTNDHAKHKCVPPPAGMRMPLTHFGLPSGCAAQLAVQLDLTVHVRLLFPRWVPGLQWRRKTRPGLSHLHNSITACRDICDTQYTTCRVGIMP